MIGTICFLLDLSLSALRESDPTKRAQLLGNIGGNEEAGAIWLRLLLFPQ